MDLIDKFNWLEKKAEELILKSRFLNRDGILFECVSPPGGHYQQAMFTRDLSYKIISCPYLYKSKETEKTLQLVLNNMSFDSVLPEYLTLEGRVEYWCNGAGPLTDNAASFLMAVIEYCKEVNDFSFLYRNVKKIKLCLDSVSICPFSNLVWIDPHNPHSGYGYTDTVQKTGTELFSSVLLYNAYKTLADILDASRYRTIKDECTEKSIKIANSISEMYDENTSLYLAASIDCRQPDIWGSAVAVFYDISNQYKEKVAEALANNYDKCVWKGQIRHIPQPYVWDRLLNHAKKYNDFKTGHFYAKGKDRKDILNISAPNRYQNGAYWATPAGWYAAAVCLVNRRMAETILSELVDFFMEDGIYECVYIDGYRKEESYTISAVLPLIGFRKLISAN